MSARINTRTAMVAALAAINGTDDSLIEHGWVALVDLTEGLALDAARGPGVGEAVSRIADATDSEPLTGQAKARTIATLRLLRLVDNYTGMASLATEVRYLGQASRAGEGRGTKTVADEYVSNGRRFATAEALAESLKRDRVAALKAAEPKADETPDANVGTDDEGSGEGVGAGLGGSLPETVGEAVAMLAALIAAASVKYEVSALDLHADIADVLEAREAKMAESVAIAAA